MKKIVIVLALASMVVSIPAYAAKVCLDTRKMESSKSKDGRIMVFKMKDGSTYVNHLQGFCPDLKYMGFVWVMQAGDTNVCENENTFRVLESGQNCTLGKFDTAAQSAPNLDAAR